MTELPAHGSIARLALILFYGPFAHILVVTVNVLRIAQFTLLSSQ